MLGTIGDVTTPTGYDELTSNGDRLFWLESGTSGTSVRCWRPGQPAYRISPHSLSVGSDIHAYGGGAFTASTDAVWWISASDNNIYRTSLPPAERSTAPTTLDAPPDRMPNAMRVQQSGLGAPADGPYGDLRVCGRDVLCVQETPDGDLLLAIDDHGERRILARTSGFFAAPTPTTGRLAWLRWGTDQMPWDASQLLVADYQPGRPCTNMTVVAGGPQESVAQPQWAPDGSLTFISDRSGWWNLYRWDGKTVHSIAPIDADHAPAPWELGYRSYTYLPDGGIATIIHTGLRHRLDIITPDGRRRTVDQPYTFIKPYLATYRDQIAMIAATPFTPPALCLVNSDGATTPINEPVTVTSATITSATSGPVAPQPLTADAVGFWLYPPNGPAADGSVGDGPVPIIVRAHPGPTDTVNARLDPHIEYFTNRGYAVADVNYRGSTGYGRAFWQSLYGRWGLDDVDDCAAVADYLIAHQIGRPGAIFITGSSAGGYTALKAAQKNRPFSAAVARSPVLNPKTWSAAVPRFQRSHAAALISAAGPVRADELAVPVLLIHGAHDPVAPASVTIDLAADLQARGAAVELLLLDTASHTLSAPELAAAAYAAEHQLYARILST